MEDKIDFVILAGGYAGSLRPITEFMPKAILPLGNKPIIRRIIEDVTSKCNINKIYVLCNHYSEIIFEYVRLLRDAGVIKQDVALVNSDPKAYSNGGALLDIKDQVSSDFLLYYSDVLPINMNYQLLIATHLKNKARNYLGTLSTSHYYQLETGYVEANETALLAFTEKPQMDERLKNMAIGVFCAEVLDRIERKDANFYRDVVTKAVADGYKFGIHVHEDAWHHFQHISQYHREHVINYEKWIS